MEFLSRCFPFIYTDGRADFSLKIIYYRERSGLINAQINTVWGGEAAWKLCQTGGGCYDKLMIRSSGKRDMSACRAGQ